MKQWTPQELQSLYLLSRNVIWRYRLDQYEDEALKTILGTLKKSTSEVEAVISRWSLGRFTAERSDALMAEFDALTLGVRGQLGDNINDVASHAGEWATSEHVSIASFGGKVADFNNIALTAEQFKEFFDKTPLGGKLLSGWVDAAFDSTIKVRLAEELRSGVLQGEGYRKLVRRIVGESTGLLEREATTLARTYVQSANVAAQEAVYTANSDIVTGVEWTATMENGHMSTGRGTCPRCAALDGQKWTNEEDRPPCPLHPRCRCLLIPVMKTWKELGMDIPEMKKVARPYTKRPNQNIDTAGNRTIYEGGFHNGDYGSWFQKQSRSFRENVIGPNRARLVEEGKVSFRGLVDRRTGKLFTLDELGARPGGRKALVPVTMGPPKSIAEAVQRLKKLTDRPTASGRLRQGVDLTGATKDAHDSIVMAAERTLGEHTKVNFIGLSAKKMKALGTYSWSYSGVNDAVQFQKTFAKEARRRAPKEAALFETRIQARRELKRAQLEKRREEQARRGKDLPIVSILEKELARIEATKRWSVSTVAKDPLGSVAVHEFHHAIMIRHGFEQKWSRLVREYAGEFDAVSVSEYATKNYRELFAEVGAAIDEEIEVAKGLRKAYDEVMKEVLK